MPKGKSKPKQAAKKPPKAKAKNVPTPTPSKKDEDAREAVVRSENARVRQAVHGMTWGGGAESPKGVQILSGRQVEIPKRPTIKSSRG